MELVPSRTGWHRVKDQAPSHDEELLWAGELVISIENDLSMHREYAVDLPGDER